MTETLTDPTAVVEAFLDAFVAMDFDTAVSYIADDCEYTNIPMGTVRGPSGVREVLEPFAAPIRENEIIILRSSQSAPVVFMERLDRHRLVTDGASCRSTACSRSTTDASPCGATTSTSPPRPGSTTPRHDGDRPIRATVAKLPAQLRGPRPAPPTTSAPGAPTVLGASDGGSQPGPPTRSARLMQYHALMDPSTAGLATAIGGRVRGARVAHGWTLDRLAEGAGVSRRMVVNVEQGTVNPSVGTLLRLSAALGVGLPSLVEPVQDKAVKVTPSGEGPVLWSGQRGGRGVLVAATELPDGGELWDWTLGPGDRHASDAHTPGTSELVHVLEGTVTVEVGDQTVVLGAGDAASFPGDVAHSYANPGRRAARFSLAVFDPAGRVPPAGGGADA